KRRTGRCIAGGAVEGEGGAGTLAHDNGAGGEVAQPPGARVEQHHQHPKRITTWQPIHEPDDVADGRVYGPQRIAILAQYPQAEQPFARRLTAPDDLEQDEVANADGKEGQRHHRDHEPLRQRAAAPEKRDQADGAAGEAKHDHNTERYLDQAVDRDRAAAGTDTGDVILQTDPLGREHLKVSRCHLRVALAPVDARARRYWSTFPAPGRARGCGESPRRTYRRAARREAA